MLLLHFVYLRTGYVICQIDTKLEEFKNKVGVDDFDIPNLNGRLEAAMLSRRPMLEDLFEAEELLRDLVIVTPS